MRISVKEIVKITRAQLLQGNQSNRINGVAIDSRDVKRENLFVAIKGKNHDGHKFINMAVNKGVKVLIVSKKVKFNNPQVSVIYVRDTTRALGQIAHHHRKQFNLPIIAITGSTGKTTTKEMLARILSSQYKVLKSPSSFNNQIGVPLTLMNLNKSHELAVLELGTNSPGEIAALSKMVEPDIAIFTNIGASHLKFLKTPNGVFKEKLSLVKGMPSDGVVIYNADDELLQKIPQLIKDKILISYSMTKNSKNKAKVLNLGAKPTFLLKGDKFVLNSPVTHNIYNAIVSIICGRIFKIRYNDIKKVFEQIRPNKGRMSFHKMKGCWVIDDTYNANPLSFNSAINTVNNINTKGRKVLVCADMLELGERAIHFHQDIGKSVAKAKFSAIFSYGALAKHIAQTAKRANPKVVIEHFSSLPELNKKLLKFSQKEDLILVKGSRGMHLERVIDGLKKNLN